MLFHLIETIVLHLTHLKSKNEGNTLPEQISLNANWGLRKWDFELFLLLPFRFALIRKWGKGDIVADLIIALFLCGCVFIISSFSKHFPLIEIASRSRNYISVYFVLMRYKVTSLVCISLSLDASHYWTHQQGYQKWRKEGIERLNK